MPSHKANSSTVRIDQVPSLPPRPRDGQKGLFGRVLIYGGSDQMIGAPVLAGLAALRSGSGLVQVALPAAVLAAALSVGPELIGLGLERDHRPLLDAAQKADVVVAGPGLGQSTAISKNLDRLFRLDTYMVVDADALNYLSTLKRWPRTFRANAVLTPHPGEMKRLAKLLGGAAVPSDEAGRIRLAVAAARAFAQVIVLKGHRTVVSDGKRVYVNQSGDSSLSKAGTGDVLSGILASLLGQGMERFEAACAATFLHGRAGEIAGKKLGRRCVLARDVIDAISPALNSF
jgi:ADP-dependent NAD(P)H-hydrate dehydratase